MTRSFFQLQSSAWWLVAIVLVSVSFAYLLYSKKNTPWNSTQNWILGGLRFLAVFLILLLLLEPSIKKVVNTIEKPIIAFAIDNSQSVIARNTDSVTINSTINSLIEEIEALDIEVKKFNLTNNNTLSFDAETSRLSSLFSSIDKSLNEKNHCATILISDGIYNRGQSPLFRNYVQPVYSVGVGDTVPPKDISISRVRYNKVTYKGTETPIEIEISQQGFTNSSLPLSLSENGNVLETRIINFNTNLEETVFSIENQNEGLRHLIVSFPQENEEISYENNKVDIFLEVIDGRQKVLIVADAPHPDIKAIRRSLDDTDSYSTTLFIPSIHTEKPKEIFDVVIYHGAFSSKIDFTPRQQPGIWYIISTKSKISTMNERLSYIAVKPKGNQPDKVTGSFNQSFSKFKIENINAFDNFPPLEVPYGDYTVSGSSEILMYQRLGNVVTKNPLMIVNNDGDQKSAILMGQNIWRWKLQEAAVNSNSDQFDDFIIKTVQYLSVKNDKKQFRFEKRKASYSDSEPVLFDVEVYNDIYERVYGNLIKVTILNKENVGQSFEFVDSELNNSFQSPSLEPGIYSYVATTNIGKTSFSEKGEFVVQKINTEYLDLTADHRLLRNLSIKTGGQFTHLDQIEDLSEKIDRAGFKPILKSSEDFQMLIKSWWYILLIFLLLSAEWTLRRYWGGY